jgi:hypothetical protein
MTHFDPDDDYAYDGQAARRARRRGKAAVGAVGLAALLGGGAFLVTNLLTDKPETIANESGALSRLVPPSVAPDSASPSASPTRHGRSGATASKEASPTPSPSTSSKSAAQRIKDARENAAKHGVPLMRPLPAVTVPPEDITVTNSGSLESSAGTLRTISARGDLTGQRELAWVTGDGTPYGDAHCTQTLHFANNTKPAARPTLMLCWHISATKSVAVVLVRAKGKPTMAAAVTALDKRWNQMG